MNNPDEGFMYTAIMQKLQSHYDNQQWSCFRIMFIFLMWNCPKQAEQMWLSIPEDVKKMHLHQINYPKWNKNK